MQGPKKQSNLDASGKTTPSAKGQKVAAAKVGTVSGVKRAAKDTPGGFTTS